MTKLKRSQILIFSFCAMAIFDNAVATEIHWDQGTRRAWVLEVINTRPVAGELLPCLDSLSDDEIQKRHFIKVHFRHIRKFVTAIAEVTQDIELKTGDEIEIAPEKCSEGKFSKFIQLLKR